VDEPNGGEGNDRFDSSDARRVLDAIDADETIAFLRDLVRVPSVNPPGDVTEAIALCRKVLEAAGFSARTVGVDPAKPNLIAELGDDGGPILCFNAHVDVVPTGEVSAWQYPPFGAHRRRRPSERRASILAGRTGIPGARPSARWAEQPTSQEVLPVETPKKRVAMVLAKNFEDVEATDPKEYLENLGAEVTVIGIERGPIEGKKGATLETDATFADVSPDDFAMLVIPGGGSPENLRIHDPAVEFTRRFVESGKPVASICHGPQLLISAKVLGGRTLTAVNKIRDDVVNAGGNYVDEPLVEDGNLITSRVPGDLPVFDEALGRALGVGVAAHAP
jgi:protease I